MTKDESVGTAHAMPGSDGGFTMCVFHSDIVPIGTKLYLAADEMTAKCNYPLCQQKEEQDYIAAEIHDALYGTVPAIQKAASVDTLPKPDAYTWVESYRDADTPNGPGDAHEEVCFDLHPPISGHPHETLFLRSTVSALVKAARRDETEKQADLIARLRRQVDRAVEQGINPFSAQAGSELAEDAARWKFMMLVADDEDGLEADLMNQLGNESMESDRLPSAQLTELVDKARAILAKKSGGES